MMKTNPQLQMVLRVPFRDLDEEDRAYPFTLDTAWAARALATLHEGEDAPRAPRLGGEIRLRKLDEIVFCEGEVDASVAVLCSRCATGLDFPVRAEFRALYSRDQETAGISPGHTRGTARTGGGARARLDAALPQRLARSERAVATDDLEIDWIDADHLDLGEVLAEQLRVQLPYQPLCRPECKGLCATCGADLNQGTCACAKLAQRKGMLN